MESWYTYRVQKDQISSQHRVYIADEADKEIERLKKVLEYYGCNDIYQVNSVDFHYMHHRHKDPLVYREILNDKGKMAREALKDK